MLRPDRFTQQHGYLTCQQEDSEHDEEDGESGHDNAILGRLLGPGRCGQEEEDGDGHDGQQEEQRSHQFHGDLPPGGPGDVITLTHKVKEVHDKEGDTGGNVDQGKGGRDDGVTLVDHERLLTGILDHGTDKGSQC